MKNYELLLFLLLSLLQLGLSLNAFAEDYSFNIDEYEKKAYDWSGYVEIKYEQINLNQDGSLYNLNYFNNPQSSVNRSSGAVELEGNYYLDNTRLSATFHSNVHNASSDSENENQFYQAYISHQPASQWNLETGKRSLKWGKGYAWNPVAFVERQKDPLDPDLSREGFVLAAADFISTTNGDLHTWALTSVLIPTTDSINKDYGKEDQLNLAVKLYLLYRDIDIDFMYLNEGSRPAQIGADFSTNLSTNFEIHGEWSHISDFNQAVLNAGTLQQQTKSVNNYLLGLRYLTENETTFIMEYYHNGKGYTEEQMFDFYSLVSSVNAATLNQVNTIANSGYSQPNTMRNYLYLRIFNKDTFEILYFTLGLTLISNLDDESYSLTPEVIYTGVNNMEFRLRATQLTGDKDTEFGEKTNESKYEIRFRYFF